MSDSNSLTVQQTKYPCAMCREFHAVAGLATDPDIVEAVCIDCFILLDMAGRDLKEIANAERPQKKNL